jgi:hypothetical protein
MPNTYVALATQTLGTAASSVTFSSIPSGYTDLVLVSNVTGIGNISAGAISIRFNSDTATNYSATYLIGDGSSATSGRSSNDTRMIVASPTLNLGNNPFVNIIQIQNYSNTTTFKTVLSRSNIAATQVAAIVGLYRSTSAITSITYESYNSQTMSIGSTFSLYGIANADQGSAKATGGIITEDSQYWYHTFGASGAFIPKQSLTCDVLVVAGGGGAGGGTRDGGGGGAGGLIAHTSQSLTATSYNVTVGGGGGGGTDNRGTANGSDSQFASLTAATGGGRGGGYSGSSQLPTSGGSGGGGQHSQSGAAGTQGNSGGAGNSSFSFGFFGGGGGGYSAAGAAATNSIGGAGGNGSSAYSSWGIAAGIGENVSGTVYFAGGGGGGQQADGTPAAAAGGFGGGGRGNAGTVFTGVAGTANTGGGGGGGGWANASGPGVGGNGASGVVIVRYSK